MANAKISSDELYSKMGYVDSNGKKVSKQQFIEDTERLIEQDKKKTKKTMEDYVREQQKCSGNYGLGFGAAVVGALVGAIPWALVFTVGYFVGWLGLLIAFLASKAYDLVKVKANTIKFWCVLVATVIGVFAGQILGDIFAIMTDAELSPYLSEVFEYYIANPGEYFDINAKNLLLGLVFAGLGSFSVLKDILKLNKAKKMFEKTGKIDF